MSDLFDDNPGEESKDWAEVVHRALYRARLVLRRFWWVMIPCVVLCGLAFVYLHHTRELTYSTRSEMVVTGRISAVEGSSVYQEELENFFGTQLRLIQSDQVQNAAKVYMRENHPEIEPCIVDYRASMARDADVFTLSAQGTNPDYVQPYLDAVMSAFIKLRASMREVQSNKARDAMLAQLQRTQKEVSRCEDAIVEFKEANNIVYLQQQETAAADFLAQNNRLLAQANSELRLIRSIDDPSELERIFLAASNAGPGGENEMEAISNLLSSIGTEEGKQNYLVSRERLNVLRSDLKEFSIYMRPKHPKIISLKEEIARVENVIAIQRVEAFEAVQEREALLQSKIANLEREVDIWEQQALKNSQLTAEYERLQSRLERAVADYTRYQNALAVIDEGAQVQQETITVLLPATFPRAVYSSLVVESAKGVALGVILASGILFVIAALDNRVLSTADAAKIFDKPLLGSIPEERDKHNREVVLLKQNDDRHVFAESCRNLRTSVFFLGENGVTPRSILITSSVPSEGKSTVTANLAVALSFSKSKVLVVDADLRKGRLHRTFKLRSERGLAEVLDGQLSVEECIQPTGYEFLDFLSMGAVVGSPSELFLSPRLDALLEQLRQRYEFVIVDSAPILATEDTSSFASKMDAVLFVVRCGYTQVRQIKPSLNRLADRKVDVSGLVLNYVDVSQPGHYQYKYADYYAGGDNPAGRKASGD